MQFRLLALLSLSAFVSASVVGRHGGRGGQQAGHAPNPQPSSTSPWYGCPDTNTASHGKVAEQCDSPPHSGTLFGCTYHTGTGTGTHSCTYNAKTGQHAGGNSDCPSTATITRSHRKRDATAF
ncbi:hypothetical protein B0H17DRAFT_1200213 [Mycena rosella]|uniref:Uncharacterized protein n=1 Tax=Mycena rosella TaxID=1033263 RepID=A0AAD7DJ07_MYCRO|nr:hypothetical protein B0H17DRAFT_1200213 [Mycena rosella]